MDFFEEVLRKIGNRPLLISSTILAIVFLANRLLIVRAVSSIASRLYLHTFVVGATHNPDETQITVSGLYIHPGTCCHRNALRTLYFSNGIQ
jgi:hypothetical protein